jgi:hypothetical protein
MVINKRIKSAALAEELIMAVSVDLSNVLEEAYGTRA